MLCLRVASVEAFSKRWRKLRYAVDSNLDPSVGPVARSDSKTLGHMGHSFLAKYGDCVSQKRLDCCTIDRAWSLCFIFYSSFTPGCKLFVIPCRREFKKRHFQRALQPGAYGEAEPGVKSRDPRIFAPLAILLEDPQYQPADTLRKSGKGGKSGKVSHISHQI